MRDMFVRLVSGKVKPGKIGEFREWYETEDVPAARKLKGLRTMLLLEPVDAPDEVVSLTIWDSEEDAEAFEKSGQFEELVKKAMPLLAEAPVRKSYSVSVVLQA